MIYAMLTHVLAKENPNYEKNLISYVHFFSMLGDGFAHTAPRGHHSPRQIEPRCEIVPASARIANVLNFGRNFLFAHFLTSVYMKAFSTSKDRHLPLLLSKLFCFAPDGHW